MPAIISINPWVSVLSSGSPCCSCAPNIIMIHHKKKASTILSLLSKTAPDKLQSASVPHQNLIEGLLNWPTMDNGLKTPESGCFCFCSLILKGVPLRSFPPLRLAPSGSHARGHAAGTAPSTYQIFSLPVCEICFFSCDLSCRQPLVIFCDCTVLFYSRGYPVRSLRLSGNLQDNKL